MPNWAILLVPPLLILACLLARGTFSPHPGHRQAAAAARHFPGARARRNCDSETAATLAWLSELEQHHEISQVAAAQIHVHAGRQLIERMQPMSRPAAWEPLPPATGPLPAAMADTIDDPRWPHLGRTWAEETGSFRALVMRGED